MARPRRPQLTYRVDLPGGQERLRELILYIADKCREAPRFGKVMLNKILWKADFDAFAKRGVPVTGRSYQRLKAGPAAIEMPPMLAEMFERGELDIVRADSGDRVVEERLTPTRGAKLRLYFTDDDIAFVDAAIQCFWGMTVAEASDESHGMAWKTRDDLDAIPYEAAYLSDDEASDELLGRMKRYAQELGLKSH
jgi:Protein of unknown function (DUF4065)